MAADGALIAGGGRVGCLDQEAGDVDSSTPELPVTLTGTTVRRCSALSSTTVSSTVPPSTEWLRPGSGT